jgi:hypothetical protein
MVLVVVELDVVAARAWRFCSNAAARLRDLFFQVIVHWQGLKIFNFDKNSCLYERKEQSINCRAKSRAASPSI